jgi:maltooligosyltrehalose trehalohydrolase
LTGHNEAYLSDYTGAPQEFLSSLKYGFLYQGQLSRWQGKPRGAPALGVAATAFVNCLQNHDQVANSGFGVRVAQLTSPSRLRAMTALWLLAPQTPMFFQGQEFAASTPFLYFADNSPEQARQVREGRAKFLSQFPTLATPEAQKMLHDPADRAAFERCKLDLAERDGHRQIYALHIDLLRLRRDDPVFRRQRSDRLDGAVLSADAFTVRFFDEDGYDRLLLVNFGRDCQVSPVSEPLFAAPPGHAWMLLWSSNSFEYGGCGTPELETSLGWRIPAEAAVVLAAAQNDDGECFDPVEEL